MFGFAPTTFDIPFTTIELHPVGGYVVALIMTLFLMNIFNFMDGMDGQAAVFGIVAGLGLTLYIANPGIVEDNYFTPEEWGLEGRGRWTRGHAIPIFENDNRREKQIGQALILQDVTDETATRQEVRRLTELLEEVSSRQIALIEAVSSISNNNNHFRPCTRPTAMPTINELRDISQRIPRREGEIFQKLASGLSVKETAHQLGLGAKSVYTYRTRLLQRMKLSSDVELAIAWRELHENGSDELVTKIVSP